MNRFGNHVMLRSQNRKARTTLPNARSVPMSDLMMLRTRKSGFTGSKVASMQTDLMIFATVECVYTTTLMTPKVSLAAQEQEQNNKQMRPSVRVFTVAKAQI
ncbi:hypothetical protein BGZ50_006293 [Haplosporangium sp. Z 11]|nr:hypothetical protein BGZ50_006293 [Haplosporangium sp. Z 11]